MMRKQVEAPRLGVQLNPYSGGARMLQSVDDGFLRNAQKVLLHFLRQLLRRTADIDIDFYARTGRPHPRALLEGSRQILPFQHGSPKVHYGAARFSEAVARHATRHIEMLVSGRGLRGHAHRYCVELHREKT